MEFFDTNIANQLQYVSLPLELVGLTLATIEVRFDSLTERINHSLQLQVQQWEIARDELKDRHPFLYKLHGGATGLHMPVPYSMYILLTGLLVLIAIAVLIVFALFVSSKTEALTPETIAAIRDTNRVFLIYLVIPLSGVLIFGLGIVFVAVKFVRNRAVGTLGIIIAGVGLLGEIYQLISQWLS